MVAEIWSHDWLQDANVLGGISEASQIWLVLNSFSSSRTDTGDKTPRIRCLVSFIFLSSF